MYTTLGISNCELKSIIQNCIVCNYDQWILDDYMLYKCIKCMKLVVATHPFITINNIIIMYVLYIYWIVTCFTSIGK